MCMSGHVGRARRRREVGPRQHWACISSQRAATSNTQQPTCRKTPSSTALERGHESTIAVQPCGTWDALELQLPARCRHILQPQRARRALLAVPVGVWPCREACWMEAVVTGGRDGMQQVGWRLHHNALGACGKWQGWRQEHGSCGRQITRCTAQFACTAQPAVHSVHAQHNLLLTLCLHVLFNAVVWPPVLPQDVVRMLHPAVAKGQGLVGRHDTMSQAGWAAPACTQWQQCMKPHK